MKNLFMATAAITLMMTTTVLTSCTSDNEDNPSTSNQEAIMVNTAALYDELGIRSCRCIRNHSHSHNHIRPNSCHISCFRSSHRTNSLRNTKTGRNHSNHPTRSSR